MSWPESAVREVAVLSDALKNAEAEIRRLRKAMAEAESVLLAPFANDYVPGTIEDAVELLHDR